MATERQVLETVARCVATMVFYHNPPRTRHATILMRAEVRTIAVSVTELGLDVSRAKSRVVAPVEGELHARYGVAEGGKLYAEFTRAFTGAAEPIFVYRAATV